MKQAAQSDSVPAVATHRSPNTGLGNTGQKSHRLPVPGLTQPLRTAGQRLGLAAAALAPRLEIRNQVITVRYLL